MSKLLRSLSFIATLPIALSLARPDASNTLKARASTCTPTAGGSSSIDDVPAITSAIASCGDGGTIVIPSGTTYYLNSVLDFAGCIGCDFQVEGLLKFASDTDYWSGRTAMINVKDIDGIKIRSVSGDGVIDGNGQDAYVITLGFLEIGKN
jgi:galacturan 1,4-alpha-galacturonidase